MDAIDTQDAQAVPREIGRCRRCRRVLTNPVSRQHGYGPIGITKVDRPADAGMPGEADALIFDDATKDVICRRDARGYARTNIPQHIILHSPTGHEFGYGGSGPADFALNILIHFTSDRAFSEAHHQEFKSRFVARVNQEVGGVIPGHEIEAWISARRAEQMALPVTDDVSCGR